MVTQLFGEVASAREYVSLFREQPSLRSLAAGDGHAVVVAPGLLASDRATVLLRRFLAAKGYDARSWELGRNRGSMEQFDTFIDIVGRLADDRGAPVSLVGWSLGGIAARWAAHHRPDAVRQVITLGSPFRRDPRTTPIFPLYQAVSGVERSDFTDERLEAISNTPLVPTTSIVSVDDRIAPPADGYQPPGPISETVEVRGSHSGLIRNPEVWRIVADRLAQAADSWTAYEAA